MSMAGRGCKRKRAGLISTPIHAPVFAIPGQLSQTRLFVTQKQYSAVSDQPLKNINQANLPSELSNYSKHKHPAVIALIPITPRPAYPPALTLQILWEVDHALALRLRYRNSSKYFLNASSPRTRAVFTSSKYRSV